jgi:hypothetical protein
MRITRISIGLEKLANAGDYSSEKARFELVAELDPADDWHVAAENLVGQGRFYVERCLGESPALRVRRSVIREVRRCQRCSEPLSDEETGYLHPACKLAEDGEREARYQEMKQQRQREIDETAGDEVEEIEGEDANELEDVPL